MINIYMLTIQACWYNKYVNRKRWYTYTCIQYKHVDIINMLTERDDAYTYNISIYINMCIEFRSKSNSKYTWAIMLN